MSGLLNAATHGSPVERGAMCPSYPALSGFENYGAAGDTFLEHLTPAVPFKRLGTAEEVAG